MEILMFIIITIILILFFRFNYKRCKTSVEKMILILYVITCGAPIIIYYLDLWDIPSQLNLTNNINTQDWLAFLSNYISSIASTILGITASIYLAFFQIRKNNEDNEKRDKENLRIQNMPLLKYNINTGIECEDCLGQLIMTTIENGQAYELNFSFKNIGLNSIKNIIIDYEADVTDSTCRLLGKNNVITIEKDEEIERNYFLSLKPNSTTKMKLTVYYEDVLNNWYKQILNIIYSTSGIFKNGKCIGNINYSVEKEEKIEESQINNDKI